MWTVLSDTNLRYDFGNGLDIHIAYMRNEAITQKVADNLNKTGVKLTEEEAF